MDDHDLPPSYEEATRPRTTPQSPSTSIGTSRTRTIVTNSEINDDGLYLELSTISVTGGYQEEIVIPPIVDEPKADSSLLTFKVIVFFIIVGIMVIVIVSSMKERKLAM